MTTPSFILMLLLLLVSSCAVKVKLDQLDKNYTLKDANFYIGDYEHNGWKVGNDKLTTISKGFMITIFYPKLPNAIQKALKEKGADSWAIEVVRISPIGGQEVIGYIKVPFFHTIATYYIPFVTHTHNKIFVKIIYAAASPSKRFQEFECPAFGHDRKISEYSYDSLDPIANLTVFPKGRVNAPLKEIVSGGFQAIEFNGGTTLKGKYFARFALLDSRDKTLYSDYQESDNILFIENEDRVIIPGCRNNAPIPPRPENDGKDFKKFKFGN
jgi:hypothetical protein